jgi:plasmid stabilization system protein ParE
LSCTVNLLAVAESDLRRMFYYIQERSPQGAERWERAFEHCLSRLQDNPYVCGLALENDAFDYELRQILFGTKGGQRYRAVFRIDDDCVTVYRLRGPGQASLSAKDLPTG